MFELCSVKSPFEFKYNALTLLTRGLVPPPRIFLCLLHVICLTVPSRLIRSISSLMPSSALSIFFLRFLSLMSAMLEIFWLRFLTKVKY